MNLLILGIVIWSLAHFVPSVAVNFRSNLVQRFGMVSYKGMFGALIVASVLCIIFGFKSASTELVFTPPPWGAYVTVVLTLIAFILLFAPYMDNSFRRMLRHPQLCGVFLWAVGHLCSSGEARTVVMFIGFAVWAVLEIVLINRREGAWTKPAPASLMANVRLVLTGIGFFALFMFIHNWLFGVGALPNPPGV